MNSGEPPHRFILTEIFGSAWSVRLRGTPATQNCEWLVEQQPRGFIGEPRVAGWGWFARGG
jgi:hypothetical protein